MSARFASVADLFAADRAAQLKDFDDQLRFLLCEKIQSPKDAIKYELPVMHYYASRLVQWDVGNGGFAQTAFNYSEWFSYAAAGYEELNKPASAKLIRDAMWLLPAERAELGRKGLFQATIGKVFAHFAESRMEMINSRIVWADWEIDAERADYAREHAAAFCAVV